MSQKLHLRPVHKSVRTVRLYTSMRVLLLGVLFVATTSCGFYGIDQDPQPLVEAPDRYTAKRVVLDPSGELSKPWWQIYNDSSLNALMSNALSANYSLQSAWLRIEQSQAQYDSLFAGKLPSLAAHSSGSRSRVEASSPGLTSTNFSLGSGLSYEIDLWGRVHAQTKSGLANLEGTQADYENTLLLLSGRIVDLWLRAQEQRALIELIKDQIKLAKHLVELTELRFKVGKASALDVYQQRQQLIATIGQLPFTRSLFKQTVNELAVLCGLPPRALKRSAFSGKLPGLPAFPAITSPAALLESRPDLRALRKRLIAANYDLAAATAERLPGIGLSLSYDFNAQRFADIFLNTVSSVASSMGLPIIDGGRRRAQIRDREAAAAQLKNLYTENFLTAIKDVDNAIIAERYQIKALALLETEIELARATLRESRARHLNGLTDYFQVIYATRSLQDLERRLINEKRELLLTRNRLYLALGGSWTKDYKSEKEPT